MFRRLGFSDQAVVHLVFWGLRVLVLCFRLLAFGCVLDFGSTGWARMAGSECRALV